MRWLFLACLVGCANASIDKPGNPGNPDAPGSNPDGPGVPPIDAPPMIDAAVTSTLTQTTAANNMSANSTTCPNGDNAWYRVFTPSMHGVNGPFHVTQVTFGAQEIGDAAQNIQVKIGLYTGTPGGATLDLAMVTPVNSTTVSVPIATDPGGPVVAPITGTIPAGAHVIVEVFKPTNSATSYMFIGASNAGETRPGYVRAPSCVVAGANVTVPTSTASLGFPQSNINISLTGMH